MVVDPNAEIEYKYLDVDNGVLYNTYDDLIGVLRNKGDRVFVRAIPSIDNSQVLYAAGTGCDKLGDPFTVVDALLVYRRLSGITWEGSC